MRDDKQDTKTEQRPPENPRKDRDRRRRYDSRVEGDPDNPQICRGID